MAGKPVGGQAVSEAQNGVNVMERLTFDGNFCDIAQCKELPCPYNGSCSQRKVWERLKAYEDTHMMPSDVTSMRMDMAIIVALFNGVDVDRMKELAKADKDGRLVVLPVRPVLTQSIRSMLYIIEDGEIVEGSLCEALVGMGSNGEINIFYTTLTDQISFEQADIGKTVFLTREAAEKALEAMKDGNS